ncbi:MAG: phosphoribosyltransferase [Sphingobium sp. 66-54]|nr:MAG: phosphoribosyltransferase [Sphingobium sp. 66-54]
MTLSDRPSFKDRQDAGRRLAQALLPRAPDNPLVLGLPRGGVPVAHEVARALGADLDVLFVRKLGAPGYEELGIGAVIDGAHPQIVLNDEIVRQVAPSADYIQSETWRQLREIERRRHLYLGERKPLSVAHRNVILVDDGIATGGTVRAALKGLRKAHAGKIVLAVPVAPADTLHTLEGECDEIVCLVSPDPFYAVGVHYADFDQTSDEEVTHLLATPPRNPAVTGGPVSHSP